MRHPIIPLDSVSEYRFQSLEVVVGFGVINL